MNEQDLLKKGFRQQPDGSWAKRPVPVGAVENPERKPDQRSEGQDSGMVSVQAGLGIHVEIISLRHRLIDAHDNLRTGAKPLVDRIAETIGLDDADARVVWDYHQLKTTGPEGTIVLISV